MFSSFTCLLSYHPDCIRLVCVCFSLISLICVSKINRKPIASVVMIYTEICQNICGTILVCWESLKWNIHINSNRQITWYIRHRSVRNHGKIMTHLHRCFSCHLRVPSEFSTPPVTSAHLHTLNENHNGSYRFSNSIVIFPKDLHRSWSAFWMIMFDRWKRVRNIEWPPKHI